MPDYGLAITPEQRSEARVRAVRFEVGKAILRVHSEYPDLTHEELLDGLLIIAGRQVQHLRLGSATPAGQPLLHWPGTCACGHEWRVHAWPGPAITGCSLCPCVRPRTPDPVNAKED